MLSCFILAYAPHRCLVLSRLSSYLSHLQCTMLTVASAAARYSHPCLTFSILSSHMPRPHHANLILNTLPSYFPHHRPNYPHRKLTQDFWCSSYFLSQFCPHFPHTHRLLSLFLIFWRGESQKLTARKSNKDKKKKRKKNKQTTKEKMQRKFRDAFRFTPECRRPDYLFVC